LEVVEISDVEATALEVAALPQLPPAALPTPSDVAAMEAAMAQLAATHSLTTADEAEIAAELASAAEAEEQAGVIAADVAVDGLEQSVIAQTGPARLVLHQEDVVRAPRASRSTLLFGSQAHIGLAKSKRTRTAKATATPSSIDMFTVAEPSAQLQLSLF
jgi:hypothetical protein